MLIALPEYLRAIARYANRTGNRLPAISVVRPMGANLDSVSRNEIERSLGCQLREHYGSLEFGGIAFGCSARCGMHVLSDQYIVEIVRGTTRVAPGEKGSVLITDLHNSTMPLIRYHIGDIGWLDPTPCRCGRTSPRIHLEGRVEDTVVKDDGELVTPEGLSRVIYGHPSIQDFQLVEIRPNHYDLRITARQHASVWRGELENSVRELLGSDATVNISQARVIAPEASGKFRHCKSASYDRLWSSAKGRTSFSGRFPVTNAHRH
jgi:phenylacetate-CoA ligase